MTATAVVLAIIETADQGRCRKSIPNIISKRFERPLTAVEFQNRTHGAAPRGARPLQHSVTWTTVRIASPAGRRGVVWIQRLMKR